MLSCKDEGETVKKSSSRAPKAPLPSTTVTTPLPSLEQCSSHVLYGYCNKVSYTRDEKVIVYIQSDQPISTCGLDVFDLSQHLIFSAPANSLFEQKISDNDPSANGYGFLANASIAIPPSIKSGLYLIEGKIPFIVKEQSPVDLLIIYPSNTANAYCTSGGKSLYTADKPIKVSSQRPIPIQSESLPCMSWFSTLPGLHIGYAADVDLDDYSFITAAKILVIVGHSEYWSRKARKNFDKFVREGGNALVLSGNTMWWQIRYSDDKKELICYKSLADPVSDPVLKTYVWVDPSLSYSTISSIGSDFDHGGYGVRYADGGWDGFKIVQPRSPLLAGLNFKKGDILNLPSIEYDGAPIKEFVNGYPVLDTGEIGAYDVELIGFDYGMRNSKTTVGTFIVMQPKKDSGVIVNVGSTNWCSTEGIGGSQKDKFQQITMNAITSMLDDKSLFLP